MTMEIKQSLKDFIEDLFALSREISDRAYEINEPGFYLVEATIDLISALVLSNDYVRLERLQKVIQNMASEMLREAIDETEKIKRGQIN